MVKKLSLCLFLFFILLMPVSSAGRISLDHEGRCNRFNITFAVSGFEAGSYDLKVEEIAANRTLEIYDPAEGWKSSFFYLDDRLTVEENRSEAVTVKTRTNNTENLTVVGRLRNGSRAWESEEHTIVQECPPKETDEKDSPPPSLTLSYQGHCKEYNVTLSVENYDDGIYDAKVSVKSEEDSRSSGRIYDPEEGWKSSYYYVDKALETVNGSGTVTLKIQADTGENITLIGKLRSGSQVWKSEEYEVGQDCPEPEPIERPLFLLIVLIAILVLLIGITYYQKGGKGPEDK